MCFNFFTSTRGGGGIRRAKYDWNKIGNKKTIQKRPPFFTDIYLFSPRCVMHSLISPTRHHDFEHAYLRCVPLQVIPQRNKYFPGEDILYIYLYIYLPLSVRHPLLLAELAFDKNGVPLLCLLFKANFNLFFKFYHLPNHDSWHQLRLVRIIFLPAIFFGVLYFFVLFHCIFCRSCFIAYTLVCILRTQGGGVAPHYVVVGMEVSAMHNHHQNATNPWSQKTPCSCALIKLTISHIGELFWRCSFFDGVVSKIVNLFVLG